MEKLPKQTQQRQHREWWGVPWRRRLPGKKEEVEHYWPKIFPNMYLTFNLVPGTLAWFCSGRTVAAISEKFFGAALTLYHTVCIHGTRCHESWLMIHQNYICTYIQLVEGYLWPWIRAWAYKSYSTKHNDNIVTIHCAIHPLDVFFGHSFWIWFCLVPSSYMLGWEFFCIVSHVKYPTVHEGFVWKYIEVYRFLVQAMSRGSCQNW